MAELKTKPTDQAVSEFLSSIEDERTRTDCFTLVEIMKQATQSEPRMWGSSIVGFGDYRYKYASGREGDWFLTGFSPRKTNLTLYLMSGFDRFGPQLSKLGKHSLGKGCLYIKRIADVDLPTLQNLVEQSVKHMGKSE